MRKADDPDLAALSSVTSRIVDALGSIEGHEWTLATPCSDWDLTALVDHVTGGNWFTIKVLAGHKSDDAMGVTVAQFGGVSATREEAIGSFEGQVDVFHQAGALEQTWSHVAGELSGRQILRLRLHDLIIHSWDIEETLRSRATLPDDLLRWGLDELAHDDSLTAEHFDLDDASGFRALDDRVTTYLRHFGR